MPGLLRVPGLAVHRVRRCRSRSAAVPALLSWLRSPNKCRCRHRVTAHDAVHPDTPGQVGFARLHVSVLVLRATHRTTCRQVTITKGGEVAPPAVRLTSTAWR